MKDNKINNPWIKAIVNKTRADYNTIAEDFSQKRLRMWQEIKPLLSPIKPGNKVLDVGCGNGRVYGELANKKVNYLGIDFSDKLIALAQKNYPQAQFRVADILASDTWARLKNYDVVVCLAVLHHFPTPALQLQVLQNIYQALKNKGLLILTVWNLYQPQFWSLQLQQWWWKITSGWQFKWLKVPYKLMEKGKINKQVDRFYYCFSQSELAELVEQAGFVILEKKYEKNLCLVAQKMARLQKAVALATAGR
jgi:2-polyprenyl-3-methyl-5-hydroxy-6-metoxy-1,4-benzoquinol methylase